jgi:hypothetical protein
LVGPEGVCYLKVGVEVSVSSSNQPAVTQVHDVAGIQFLRFEHPMTDEEHAAFLEESTRQMDENATGGGPLVRNVMIIDTDKATRGTPVQRKRQSEWQEQNKAYFEKHVLCAVFIASSSLVRGALRAVGWLKPFPYPHRVSSSIDEAIAIATEILRENGEAVRPTAISIGCARSTRSRACARGCGTSSSTP